MGRGIGKAMLTRAAEEAWALGASRVWLHTCTLDSPRALPNYQARGFEETRTETSMYSHPEDAMRRGSLSLEQSTAWRTAILRRSLSG